MFVKIVVLNSRSWFVGMAMRLPVQVAASRISPLRYPPSRPITVSRKVPAFPRVPVECAVPRTFVGANEGTSSYCEQVLLGAAYVGQRHALPAKSREFSAVDFRSRLGYSSEVLTYQ
jgi:hypothetical protein